MTLQERVGILVRYCGQYQSHGFMMDERNTDNFNIQLPEEAYIREHIKEVKVILLTGEAGDGKSRIMRNISGMLQENGFSEACQDFSALPENEKRDWIKRLEAVLAGESSEKLVILANVGIFTQAIIQFSLGLMEELTRKRNDVYICNFETRNLAGDKKVFENIVKTFLSYEENCTNIKCPCHDTCSYKENIEKLLTLAGMNAMRTICDAIYLKGGHITFRELLSLLAYTVTFGQDCQERILEMGLAETERKNRGVTEEEFGIMSLDEGKYYHHIFDESEDILLSKISRMDPGLQRGRNTNVVTKREYRDGLRKAFFDREQDSYGMLHVEYLKEFREALEHVHKPPYYFDTAIDHNPALLQLKKGINKMENQGKSDAGLVVTDTPSIFDNKIRMEFLVTHDISLIWHRYDLQMGGERPRDDVFWNKFYLSYQHKAEDGERQLISLLIDYNQFRYLMLCSQNFFLNRNGLRQEEYAVNTFYRKILAVKKDAYSMVKVCFDESVGDYSDFSLKIHSESDFWSDDERQSILIGKGD